MTPKINVNWLPAHPSYGSISMSRYAKQLTSAATENDRFLPNLLATPGAHRGGALARQFHRQISYPLRIKFAPNHPISHILDHSWSDLLRHIPPTRKKVVTVHDLIPLRFPGELSSAQQGKFRSWVNQLRHADALIAVSEYTKAEVTEFLQIDPEKIFVVPNGVEIPSPVATRKDAKNDVFTIGSIGSSLLRKNNQIFPEALRILKARISSPVRLIRVGPKFPAALSEEISEILGENGLTELGRIPDDELAPFYASVDCVAVPSLYEGFGLPVLEALASRTPVASSHSTSLPEVGGNIPEYFDPLDPSSFASSLEKIVNGNYDEARIQNGFERAKQFSWRKSLNGIFSVYDQLL